MRDSFCSPTCQPEGVNIKPLLTTVIVVFSGFTVLVSQGQESNARAKQSAEIDASKYINQTSGHCGIQDAIDEAAKADGGTVTLPAGTFVLNRYLFLRDNITLQGQGEKTVLTLGKPCGFAKVIKYDQKAAPNELTVEGDLSSLKPGSLVRVYGYGANTHPIHRSRPRVKEVRGNVVVFDGSPGRCQPDHAFINWGLFTTLKEPAKKGQKSIRIEHPELLGPQQGLYFEGPGDVWNHHINAVVKVEGDLVTLDREITINAEAGDEVHLIHNAITGDQDPVTKQPLKNVTIRNLTIDGRANELDLRSESFRQAAIHFNRTENLTIRNVTVRNWHNDAFSLQGQTNLVVSHCHAVTNNGHGFHPGTGVKGGEFTNCVSQGNRRDGIYYCWHNNRVNVRGCTLSENGNYGIGGLGNPGDHNNLIENNVIERNGAAGIECRAGGSTNNTIRNNIIRDNSQKEPGAMPGLVITGGKEGARNITIENNVIESTLDVPTQWVGIEERHTIRSPQVQKGQSKALSPPMVVSLANENRLIGNKLKGHKSADIIVRGPDTVVEGNSGEVLERRQGLGPITSKE